MVVTRWGCANGFKKLPESLVGFALLLLVLFVAGLRHNRRQRLALFRLL